jgi:hypothetical protein
MTKGKSHFISTFLTFLVILCVKLKRAEISHDISAWNIDSAKAASASGVERLWDASNLRAAVSTKNYESLKSLLEKLNNGLPITVVALGDSITSNHGGCYQRDKAHIKEHAAAYSWAFLNKCQKKSRQNEGSAWLSTFMRTINASWPNADHLLINAGKYYTL